MLMLAALSCAKERRQKNATPVSAALQQMHNGPRYFQGAWAAVVAGTPGDIATYQGASVDGCESNTTYNLNNCRTCAAGQSCCARTCH